jgi:alkylation response protein AidB-like acyl-CoA dehydrogenase
MSFHATPMFSGDMYDTSLRLAASADDQTRPGAPNAASAKWRQMLALGWQGVLIAEDDGGAGAALSDLAAIVEAMARHAQVAPLAGRCAVAPLLLAACRAHAGVRPLLAAVAAGQASVCAVIDADARLPGAGSAVRLAPDARLHGSLKGVDLSEPATHLLSNTREGPTGTPVLVLLPLEPLLDRARHYAGVDGRMTCDIDLQGVTAGAADVLLRGEAVLAAVDSAYNAGSLLACVQAVGAGGAMIEQTIDYLNTRTQFGVQLSSFQALRHRLVDMYVAYENARGMVRRLVEQSGQGACAYSADTALVKLSMSGISRMLAESAIQLHGGMGMTLEMPVARLAMHSLAGSLQSGDKSQCLDWLTAQTVADAARA